MTNLGYLALRLGEWDRAATESQRAIERSRSVGDGVGVVVALVNLGFASLHRERTDDAAAAFGEALALLREVEDRESIAYCLDGVAAVVLRRGDAETALRLLSAAAGLREAIGASLPPFERELHEGAREEARRSAAGRAAAAEAAGRALAAEDALDLAAGFAAPRH